jgi:hypothetical protein
VQQGERVCFRDRCARGEVVHRIQVQAGRSHWTAARRTAKACTDGMRSPVSLIRPWAGMENRSASELRLYRCVVACFPR